MAKLETIKIHCSRLFTVFALSFLAGVFLASSIGLDYVQPVASFAFIGSLLLLTAFANLLLRNHIIVVASFALIFLLGGFTFFSRSEANTFSDWPFGETAVIQGKVAERPEISSNKERLVIAVSKVETEDGGIVLEAGRSLLLVYGPIYPKHRYGDTIAVRGKIEKPGEIEDFDFGRYLKKYPLYGVVFRPDKIEERSVSLTLKDIIYRRLHLLSEVLERSLNRSLPEPHASLAGGIILGQKRAMPDDFNQALSITGLTHIIALSGFNVTIITSALAATLALHIGRRKSFYVGLVIVTGFVILTGVPPSIVRAAIFSLLMIAGRTFGRQGDQTNLMLLAAGAMVLANPFVLQFDLGFQLSFLAFAGLIYLAPLWSKWIEKSYLRKSPGYFRSALAETLAAQVAVLPLILTTFGRLSLISPLANIAVIWVIPWAMAASFFVAIFGAVSGLLGRLLSAFLWPMLEYIVRAIEFMARLPLASVEFGRGAAVLKIILYGILVSAALVIRKRLNTRH